MYASGSVLSLLIESRGLVPNIAKWLCLAAIRVHVAQGTVICEDYFNLGVDLLVAVTDNLEFCLRRIC